MSDAVKPTLPLPSFGKRLKRLRRIKGLKQEAIASMANVNQATVSRWEAGSISAPPEVMDYLLRMLSQAPVQDSALRRLVECCTQPVHLVTDIDHRLLAASASREHMWGIPATDLLHTSLWKFATEDIVRAECRLHSDGWWEREAPEPVVVELKATQTVGLHIPCGTMVWERVWLANGTPARLCTTLQGRA